MRLILVTIITPLSKVLFYPGCSLRFLSILDYNYFRKYVSFLIANNYWLFYSYVLFIFLFSFFIKCFKTTAKCYWLIEALKFMIPIYQDIAWKISESLNSFRHMVYNKVVYCCININLRQRQNLQVSPPPDFFQFIFFMLKANTSV